MDPSTDVTEAQVLAAMIELFDNPTAIEAYDRRCPVELHATLICGTELRGFRGKPKRRRTLDHSGPSFSKSAHPRSLNRSGSSWAADGDVG